MLCQSLSNPTIFPLIGTDEDDKTVSSGVVSMQEVCDDAEEAQSASNDYELILLSKFAKDVLLKLLW